MSSSSAVWILADTIVVLQQGRVVESGTTRQVLHEPKEQYTKRLVAAAPIPDPELQRLRREERLEALRDS